jgi:hypothetical protein
MRVLGGPADGAEIPSRPGAYVWLDANGRRSRVPRPGASMYRKGADSYVYCGHRLTVCTGCGAIVDKQEPRCRLCGARV